MEVDTAGPCTYNPQELMLAVVALLQAMGLQLNQVSEEVLTVPGQWQPLPLSAAPGHSDRMRIHVQNAETAERVRTLLHEKAFQAGSDTIALTVHQLGFQTRKPSGRAGLTGSVAPSSA